jgi:hypothetical protein
MRSADSSLWKYEINDTKIFGEHVYFERVLTFSDGTNIKDYSELQKIMLYLYILSLKILFILTLNRSVSDVYDF